MSLRPQRLIACCLAGGLVAGLAMAEISIDGGPGPRVNTLQMSRMVSFTDGADPVPYVDWQAYRLLPLTRLLNPSGAARPDGRPFVAWRPETAAPFVVWAYKRGVDHDIAYAEWAGNSWSEIGFLTSDTGDEVDPQAFVEPGGTVHIVWWVRSNDPHVMLTSRGPQSVEWSVPVRVSPVGELARRPSVCVFQQSMRVAYEREPDGDTTTLRHLVVRRRDSDVAETGFALEHTAAAQNDEVLDPVLHVLRGRMWLDWKYSADEFAFAVYNNSSGWGETFTGPWLDPSWVGTESARMAVQRTVTSLDAQTPIDPDDPMP